MFFLVALETISPLSFLYFHLIVILACQFKFYFIQLLLEYIIKHFEIYKF